MCPLHPGSGEAVTWAPWRGPVGEYVERERAAAAIRVAVARSLSVSQRRISTLEDWLKFKSEEFDMSPEERRKYNEEALVGHNLDDVQERARILMCAAEADYFSEVPALAGGVKGQARVHAARLASELLMCPVEGKELVSGGLYDLDMSDGGPRARRFATVFWNKVWGRR